MIQFQKAAAIAVESDSPGERRAAKFNEMCCHASFGDVEVAQLCLRDALEAGLDFEAALKDPGLVRLESSAQVRIQLRKFSEGKLVSRRTLQVRAMEEKKVREGNLPVREGLSGLQLDMNGLEDGQASDQEVVLGIVKRVALLILASVVSFAVLFYGGYQFLNVR